MVYFVLIMSVIAFIVCGVDKSRAKRHKWRIPERTLLLLSFFGGAIGFWIGMHVFHHKTKKNKFRIPVPIFALLHIALCVYFSLSRVL